MSRDRCELCDGLRHPRSPSPSVTLFPSRYCFGRSLNVTVTFCWAPLRASVTPTPREDGRVYPHGDVSTRCDTTHHPPWMVVDVGDAGRVPSPSASSSMAEQRTLNPQVQGSNPWGRTQTTWGASAPPAPAVGRQKAATPAGVPLPVGPSQPAPAVQRLGALGQLPLLPDLTSLRSAAWLYS